MVVVTILGLLLFSIALPTLDTWTDIKMVYKLYRGAPYCADESHSECSKNPVAYCSMAGYNQTVCPFSSHPTMATVLLIPFLLNYVVCFITFLRKEKNRKHTFIFALLNIYPQFGTYEQSSREIIGIIIFNISVVARIIYLLVKKPSEGQKEKKIFDQEVGLMETCLESVPTVFIMIIIIFLTSENMN